MSRLTTVIAATSCLVLAAGALPQAHEIGTTTVSVQFSSRDAYRIEIVTDVQALTEKLHAVLNGTPQGPDTPAFDETLFLTRVNARFDGRPVRPDVHMTVATPPDGSTGPRATITLTGNIPDGAREFAWQYGWTFASYPFTVAGRGGQSRTQWLDGSDASAAILFGEMQEPLLRLDVIRQYLVLGFTHIVPKGTDHILFVIGLFLLGTSWRALLWQVSAFTVAHTLTLGLAANGLVSVPPTIVEPLIALSIAYVAIENMMLTELRPWRVALVFAFGLLHGLGFAGVLGELGLPRTQFVPALLAFNVGVEAGQLAVIGVAAALVGWWRTAPSYRPRIVMPASLAIACVAMMWAYQRL